LNDGLAYALEAQNSKKNQDMVDKALVRENRKGIMEHKRKMQCTGAPGNNKKLCDGFSSKGPIFCSGQQQRMQVIVQGFQTLHRQIQRTNFWSPRSAPPPSQKNNNAQNI
jgi:hypothetical protein